VSGPFSHGPDPCAVAVFAVWRRSDRVAIVPPLWRQTFLRALLDEWGSCWHPGGNTGGGVFLWGTVKPMSFERGWEKGNSKRKSLQVPTNIRSAKHCFASLVTCSRGALFRAPVVRPVVQRFAGVSKKIFGGRGVVARWHEGKRLNRRMELVCAGLDALRGTNTTEI
jgi:hypothetical protein